MAGHLAGLRIEEDADAASTDAPPTPGSLFRDALARVAARTERNQPPPPPPIVTKAPNAAAFLKVAAPMLLPRADSEFMTLELAAAAAARCPTGGDYFVVRSGADAVLGALRPPIGDGTLRLCGDGNDGVAMQAALLLAECLAEAEANVKQVSGPASLAEAFSRQLAFRRRWKAPEKTGGLRIFSRRRPAEDAGRPELVTGESRSAATVVEWLDACEVEAGIPADKRTPGRVALERFGGVYVRRQTNGELACICGVVGQATSPGGRRIGLVYTPPDLRKCGHATELVKGVTLELLDDRTGPGFATVVVPAGAPDGLWTRAGYLHVGDTAEYRLDLTPREPLPTPPARAPDGLDDGSPEFRDFVSGLAAATQGVERGGGE
jgi:hypothetical protein